MISTPKGIRIPVSSVKGKCPRPLDYGGNEIEQEKLFLLYKYNYILLYKKKFVKHFFLFTNCYNEKE